MVTVIVLSVNNVRPAFFFFKQDRIVTSNFLAENMGPVGVNLRCLYFLFCFVFVLKTLYFELVTFQHSFFFFYQDSRPISLKFETNFVSRFVTSFHRFLV